jgi:hypothetical protein
VTEAGQEAEKATIDADQSRAMADETFGSPQYIPEGDTESNLLYNLGSESEDHGQVHKKEMLTLFEYLASMLS